MSEHARSRPRLNVTSIVAIALVGLGILLWMFVDRGLLFVAGLGAFGPGLLRELGVLSDQDEFQREAARRAGYHAYLLGGLAAVLILTFIEWSGSSVSQSDEWIRIVLVVLWLSWLASSVMSFWGAQRTTSVVLLVFGAFWLLFGLADVIGSLRAPDPNPDWGEFFLGMGAFLLLVVPWFVLAWTVHRWPRATAAALLLVAVVLLIVFRPAGPSAIPLATQVLTTGLLVGPFLVCGLALLSEARANTS